MNRVDLAQNLVYGGGSGGEASFIFGAVGPPPACEPLRFTVIFEYDIHKESCAALRDWARQWANLGTLPLGSAVYNAALETITEQFARAGAAPASPNGSALARLRTNEMALADPSKPGSDVWELREFRLYASGALTQDRVARTPAPALNGTQVVADFVNAN